MKKRRKLRVSYRAKYLRALDAERRIAAEQRLIIQMMKAYRGVLLQITVLSEDGRFHARDLGELARRAVYGKGEYDDDDAPQVRGLYGVEKPTPTGLTDGKHV